MIFYGVLAKANAEIFLKSANLGMDICFNIKYNISIKKYQIILDCRKGKKTI